MRIGLNPVDKISVKCPALVGDLENLTAIFSTGFKKTLILGRIMLKSWDTKAFKSAYPGTPNLAHMSGFMDA